MRYNEFIMEDFATGQTILNQAKTIRQNCLPYLKQNRDAINRYPIYRGVKPPGGHSVTGAGDANVIRKEVRLTDRRPSDTPRELHHFVNQYFVTHYGAPFRTAMFTTGSLMRSQDYGTAYIIFPAGDFKYLWSPEVEDMYAITIEYGDDHHREPGTDQGTLEDIADHVLSTYQTDDLESAIDSDHEIMIRCSHYYGIHPDVMHNAELRNQIREILYK